MYTLAKFVRDAQEGMSLEIIERFGKTGDEIPERLRGVRKIIHINTYKMELMNAQSEVSSMWFESAKLVEYDGETLTIYNPIRRELTPEEQRILDKINAKETYFQKVECARNSSCPWINPFGNKVIKGKKYLSWENKVLDRSVRGEMILKYRVIKS